MTRAARAKKSHAAAVSESCTVYIGPKGAVTRNNFSCNLTRRKILLQVALTMLHVTIAMRLVLRKK